MTPEQNKACAIDVLDRLLNHHDVAALHAATSNPAVVGSGTGLLKAFPDLEGEIRWAVAEDDMVVVFHDIRGTQQGPWLFVTEPTRRRVETSFILAFRFGSDGQIIDSWLGSNFVQMFAQLGWGFAPVGATVPQRG
jgi:predicted ester cyclase